MIEKKRDALRVGELVRRSMSVMSKSAEAKLSDLQAHKKARLRRSKYIVPILLALGLTSALPASVHAAGLLLPYPLHTSGSQIVDSSGTPVRLCSVGWAWYGGYGNLPNSINVAGYKSMLNAIAGSGINCVRICTCDQQVATNAALSGVNTTLNPDLAGLNYNQVLQTMVNYGATLGLKFIIESHNNEGGNDPPIYGSANPRGIWYDLGVPGGDGTDGAGQTATVTNANFLSIWQTRANLFAGNSAVIGYDLINEPHYGTITWGDGNAATDLRLMYQNVGNAILAIDSNKLIICEGAQNYGTGLPEGDLTVIQTFPVSLNVANRVVYSDHVYPNEVAGFSGPDNGSGWITRMNSEWGYLVSNNTAPVWIGECGDDMHTSDGTTYANSFIAYVNGLAPGGPTFSGIQQGIGWDWWDFEALQNFGTPNFGMLNTSCNGLEPTQQSYWTQMLSVNKGGNSTSGPAKVNAGGPAASPFVADADFSGGTAATNWTGAIDTSAVTSPAPQAVYQSERYGAETYTFPGLTANGAYTVRLHFCENFFTASAQRTFNVSINSVSELSNFDIYATAGAIHKANIQQFNVNANGSGQIIIAFTNVVNNALINGIEVNTAVAIPAAPTGLTATGSSGQVALSWNASPGATAYDVKRSTVSGSGYATVSSPTTTSYTNTGLTNGTTYYFVVDAKNSAGTSGNSAQASATPAATALPIQINAAGPAVAPFVADIDFSGGTTATNWTGAITTTGVTNPAPQAVYQSERYGAMTYTIPGLVSGTAYTVRLHFCENFFTATAQRTFNVSINSTSVLSNFDIFAASGAIHKANVQQFNVAANASGQEVIVFTNVVNNALVNGIEIVAASAPPAPTGLGATPGNAQIALSWSASSGATSYNVYRGTAAGGESATAIVTGIATTSYTNTGLTNGTHYYYTVKAVNANGTSGASNEANATPVAPPAIAFVQVNSNCPVSASSIPVLYNTAQVAGHFNVVVVGWNDITGTVSSVTDSAGNTYTRAIGPTVGGAQQISIYYASNIHAGSNTVTVTMSGTMDYPDVRILEYAGLTTVDKTAGASGSSITSNSGSVTTTAANELIFSANNVSNSTGSAGTGFTSRTITIDGDIAEDQIVTATGAYSGTANINGTANNWVAQIVTFK